MKRKLPKILLNIHVFLVLVFLLAPIVVIAASSFTQSDFIAFPPEGLSLKWYADILNHPEFIESFYLSVRVALGTALVATIIGTLASLAVVRYEFRGKEAIIQLTSSPLMMPTVVLGIALLQYYAWIGLAPSTTALIFGHIILAVPYVMRLVVASLAGFDRTIEKAAMNLGASPLRVFFQVTLPTIKSGIIAGGVFAFITSFDDLTVALFIVSTDVVTLPVRIFTYMEWQYDPLITSVSTMIIMITVVLMLIIEKILGVGKMLDPKKD
ncbi:ABC transporter permease subunit [Oceanobacillus sp. 143]|uniref:ABC transporter permease n=1 Tax=Oceanobacillus zhaokaii TaxID=2052660 RepID=A0A345PK74_9BACI|nr:ABC transporter permease [Oceanobacillus zhaokaii]AXI10404.1 ABC transporter permease [Oceanobacillus zhaokaii]QGS69426.1 ABC transporter permease subunit [Oceanobacillus sp. 143]